MRKRCKQPEDIRRDIIACIQNLPSVKNSSFHDPQRNPLPDANDIEQEANGGSSGSDSSSESSLEQTSFQDAPTPRPSHDIKQDIQRLRNITIGLLITGLTLGCIVGVGVAILLKRSGLADPPNPNQRRIYERSNISVHRDRLSSE